MWLTRDSSKPKDQINSRIMQVSRSEVAALSKMAEQEGRRENCRKKVARVCVCGADVLNNIHLNGPRFYAKHYNNHALQTLRKI